MVILLACQGEAPSPAEVVAPLAELSGEAVVFVGEPVGFDAGDSAGDTFTWDFGDGSSGEGIEVEHTYAAPGRYTVRLTATSSDGRTDIASATRVAVYEPLATPPTASGRLALLDGVLYAALPDADEIAVVEGGAVVERLATCGHPVSVSAAAGTLAVACRDDAVQLWDTATRTLREEVPLRWGARPTGVAIDGEDVVVALAGTGEVVRLSGDAVAVADPRALAVAEGVVFAPRFRSPEQGGVVNRVGEGEFALALDPGPDSDTDARGLPTLLGAVAVRPDGRALVVAGAKANVERGLRRDGLPYTHETATRASLRSIDPVTGEQLARDGFDNRDLVGAVAFTPLGDRLLVAHLGAGVVDVLDPFTLTRVGGFQAVGVGLDGLATDGATAWVLASVDKELVAYDLGAGNAEVELARVALGEADLGERVFHFAGDPRMSGDAYLSCASCHLDGGTDARTWDFSDRGEGFRDTQALFSIPDDGPFHWSANFDELQDFENAIRDHQAGDGFVADEDLTDPLGEPKAGLSEELDALAAYVRAFPVPRSPFREEDGAQTEAALRGREVFYAEGCDTCHAGDDGTDAGFIDGEPVLHDVGTLLETSGERAGEPLTGLRTPSLRGLFATAPYLHDGRAATLEQALVAHGVASDAELVRYLLEIE
ncbi:MAG: PKD domain-containing protein [Myxococcota bacterium]